MVLLAYKYKNFLRIMSFLQNHYFHCVQPFIYKSQNSADQWSNPADQFTEAGIEAYLFLLVFIYEYAVFVKWLKHKYS